MYDMTSHTVCPGSNERTTECLVEEETGTRTKTRSRRTKRPRCKLDPDGWLTLHDILISFNGPISEEQAWALCYQTAKTLSYSPPSRFYELTDLSQLLLHKDGDIRPHTCMIDSANSSVSERKLVFSLGMMIFKALDFGLDEEEERPLAPDLEALITLMTHSGQAECGPDAEERLQETDDEGIERDSGENELDELLMRRTKDLYGGGSSLCSLDTILQLCTRHMQGANEQADAHYQAVIRALVAEALELSQFLEKVAAEKQQVILGDSTAGDIVRAGTTSHLDSLDFSDWARFWVQVIGELRKGVKLKEVEAGLGKRGSARSLGRGAEFELTPYEILMDDIRARRYRLKKTPMPSPHLRKDARAVILEFIRSRPPLKKASERKLPPLKKQCTPRELLMESIKRPPRPLRSSVSPGDSSKRRTFTMERTFPGQDNVQSETYVKEGEQPTKPRASRRGSADLNYSTLKQPRRLIPVDFDLKLDGDEEEDDDEEYVVTRFEDEDEATNYWQPKEDYIFDDQSGVGNSNRENAHEDEDEKGSANPWRKTGGLRLTRNEYHRFCDAQLESYDLATQCPSRRASARKHAVGGSNVLSSLGTASLPHSRPQSRQHLQENVAGVTGSSLNPSPNLSPSPSPRPRARPRPSPSGTTDRENQEQNADWQDEQKTSLGDMFLDERLSLTLEEIVHIRSVLTKAELESLPVEGRVKEDVEKRRVCFLCLKTRFGLLGPWGQRCRLCERTVCVKCYSKMRIPTEHFSHVPVVLLSPGLLLSPTSSESDCGVKHSWLRPAGGVGSAPVSPAARRRDSALRNATPVSTPSTTPTPHSQARREDDSGSEKLSYKVAGSPAKLSTTSSYGALGGLSAEQRLAAERLRGVAMVVCHDCRIMVIQIIKSSRTTRATIRNNVISRLTLNLSPVYV